MKNKAKIILLSLSFVLSSCSETLRPYKKGEPEGYQFYNGFYSTDSTLAKTKDDFFVKEVEINGKAYPILDENQNISRQVSKAWYGKEAAYFYYCYDLSEPTLSYALFQYDFKTEKLKTLFDQYIAMEMSFTEIEGSYPILKSDHQYGTICNEQFIWSNHPILYANNEGYVYQNNGLFFAKGTTESDIKFCEESAKIFNNPINAKIVYQTKNGVSMSFDPITGINDALPYQPDSYLVVESSTYSYEGPAIPPEEWTYESTYFRQDQNKYFLSVFDGNEYEIMNLDVSFEDIKRVVHLQGTPIYNIFTEEKVYTYDVHESTWKNDSFSSTRWSLPPSIKNIEYLLYSDEKFDFYVNIKYAPDLMAITHWGFLCRAEKDSKDKRTIGEVTLSFGHSVSDKGFRLGIDHIEPNA